MLCLFSLHFAYVLINFWVPFNFIAYIYFVFLFFLFLLFFVFAFCWSASCSLRNFSRTKFVSFQVHLFGLDKQHTTFFGPKVILAFVSFHQYRLSIVLSILSTNLGHSVKPRSTTWFSIFLIKCDEERQVNFFCMTKAYIDWYFKSIEAHRYENTHKT